MVNHRGSETSNGHPGTEEIQQRRINIQRVCYPLVWCSGWQLDSVPLLISHRPLLYGLEIVEDFKVLNSYAFESRDYQVTPGSPWNYALRLQNDSQPEKDLTFASKGLELGVPPFSLKGAPGMIMAQVGLLNYESETCSRILTVCSPPSFPPLGSHTGFLAAIPQCSGCPTHIPCHLFQPPHTPHSPPLWSH